MTRGKVVIAEKRSKALNDSDISHEEFTLVINEEPNYHRLKEGIRIKDSQLDDIKKERLIELGKRIWIYEKLKENERHKTQNSNIKSVEIIRQY